MAEMDYSFYDRTDHSGFSAAHSNGADGAEWFLIVLV
jgi:hypothetical protein